MKAQAVLARQPRSESPFVFPSPRDSDRARTSDLPLWDTVRREAGIIASLIEKRDSIMRMFLTAAVAAVMLALAAGAGAASEEGLTREERVLVQRGLAALGYEAGPADGLFGPRTRSAIWEWQEAKGNEATGYLTREQAGALATAGADAPEQAAEGPRPFRNEVLRLPQCEEMPEGSACWQTLANKSGCRYWTAYFNPEAKVTWSGGCDDGAAHGQGTLSYELSSGNVSKDTGELVDGKRHGHWVFRWADGDVREGLYVDGKEHGHWVLRWADGDVWEGPYVDGKAHGHWVHRGADGDVWEGPYVDGKRHGHWVFRLADGSVHEGLFVDGEVRGWVERTPDGRVRESPYSD